MRLGHALFLATLLVAGCAREKGPEASFLDASWQPPEKLSDYRLFQGNGSTQQPAPGVLPYDINTPLFSDYAAKYRFVWMPPGASATCNDTEVLDFPQGTILVKTFAYPHDLRDPGKGQRLMETRLLLHRPEGWTGLPYVWNEEQTEAVLKIAGGTRDVSWIGADGADHSLNYIIPNVNQCLACHENSRVMRPIGPKVRNLNRDFGYSGGRENQLTKWTQVNYLKGAPSPGDAPRLPEWDNPSTGTVEQRARAWMEMNCAHCHNPKGPARTSGLDLRYDQNLLPKIGFYRTPTAAGRGSGGRLYDIVPGKPDESILMYRIGSAEPGVMMPELGRRLVDQAGVALVREWIASLK